MYLIGYSAGGDGVYQLAPRMADRFAAVGMCAGHPNSVTPEGLRNLPFFLYMGGEDSAYHRNEVVKTFSAAMDTLQAADPQGYFHRLTVYAGLQHNMQGREAEMIPRMVPLRRQPGPAACFGKRTTTWFIIAFTGLSVLRNRPPRNCLRCSCRRSDHYNRYACLRRSDPETI